MKRTILSTFLVLAFPAAAHACTTGTAALQRSLERLSYDAGPVDGCYGAMTRYAVRAFQRAEGLTVDGVAGPKTRARLARASAPTPRLRTGTHAEIDLERQLLFVVARGRVRETVAISSGRRGYETPTGLFRVFRKEVRSWSVPYRTWMPWASYFTGGVAVHEGEVGSRPSSHGCVHVPKQFAASVYRRLVSGTTVYVY